MKKPENTYIASIHNKFPVIERPYFEKMYNPLRAGTPDMYYSGDIGDLWVEYKFLPSVPRINEKPILPNITPRQRKWLNDRYEEGRNVAVIVGVPNGGVILLQRQWEIPLAPQAFNSQTISKASVANWILSQTGVQKCSLKNLET